MREIKFRAWQAHKHRFLDFDWMIRPNGRVYSIVKDEIWDDFTDEVEVTQYTGLDDALGHQIYEGDIVEYTGTDPYEDPSCCSAIEYDNGQFVAFDESLLKCASIVEVIGNKFANPELLGAGL